MGEQRLGLYVKNIFQTKTDILLARQMSKTKCHVDERKINIRHRQPVLVMCSSLMVLNTVHG